MLKLLRSEEKKITRAVNGRLIRLTTDDTALLADIAASLRILAGRPALILTSDAVTIPEEVIPAESRSPSVRRGNQKTKPARAA